MTLLKNFCFLSESERREESKTQNVQVCFAPFSPSKPYKICISPKSPAFFLSVYFRWLIFNPNRQ